MMNKKYFGFWGIVDGDSKLPPVLNCVDVEWAPTDRNQLIEYIVKCPVAVASASIRTPCLICGTPLSTSSYQSDNHWLWPVDLQHYIIEHNVKLPDALCEHIRQAKYKPPTEITAELDQLPWPD